MNQKDTDKYLTVLSEEMALRSPEAEGETFRTVYFGGGTPSLLQPVHLQRILDDLHTRFHIDPDAEVTIEANPEQLSLDYCKALKSLGFNRLSIGVQSFQDDILQFLGRRHTAQQALDAITNAHTAGFDNLSIDLIYGINERSNELWKKELETAFALPIRHFSAYALTVEENSLLYRRIQQHRNVEPDEELAAVQYDILSEMVAKSPFTQYEVSNFAMKGWESKHNSAYWNRTPYIGLGPAAHSFDGFHRSWNAPTLSGYFSQIEQRKPYHERETLTDIDQHNEFVLLGLRTRNGINLREMEELFGHERTVAFLKYFESEVESECYRLDEHYIRLTPQGLWHADGIASGAFLTNSVDV